MADSEELAEIRERKREALERRLREGGDHGDGASADGDGAGDAAPSDPVDVGSEAHLSELLADHDVVLVDFYADWCGPCQMLEPRVERLARETPAAVATVDIDAHQGLATQYRVQGVPTLLLFVDGDPVERVVGVRDYASLADLVSAHAG
jgi:thioredoxin 1